MTSVDKGDSCFYAIKFHCHIFKGEVWINIPCSLTDAVRNKRHGIAGLSLAKYPSAKKVLTPTTPFSASPITTYDLHKNSKQTIPAAT